MLFSVYYPNKIFLNLAIQFVLSLFDYHHSTILENNMQKRLEQVKRELEIHDYSPKTVKTELREILRWFYSYF
jgi:hypothetical protein